MLLFKFIPKRPDGGARMPENTGKKFGEILSEKRQKGKL
jgi:hypothetical protein